MSETNLDYSDFDDFERVEDDSERLTMISRLAMLAADLPKKELEILEAEE